MPAKKTKPAATPHKYATALMVHMQNCSIWQGNSREPSREGLDELCASIEKNGILQPLLARRDPDNDGDYQIIAGARRFRAAAHVGLEQIPVYVLDLTDAKAAAAVAAENIVREDFAPLDAAVAVKATLDAYGSTQAAADALARPVGWVRRVASLDNLTPRWHAEARDAGLSLPFLIELARLPQHTQDSIYETRLEDLTADGGDLAALRLKASRLMASVVDSPWLKSDKNCALCSRRTDADLLLWPDMASKDAQCLDPACREMKRQAYVAAQKVKAAKAAGTTPDRVATADWSRRDDVHRKDPHHTVPVVIDEGPQTGAIVWRAPEAAPDPADATPRGPSPEQRLAARYIREIKDRVDNGAVEQWAASQTDRHLLAACLMFGCHGEHPLADAIVDRFHELCATNPAEDVADRLHAGIAERLKFDKVSDCEDAYAWAKAIAEILEIDSINTKGATE